MNLSKAHFKKIISHFSKKNILVIGDIILDHYIFGKVERISPEAPVPVVWAREEKFFCGGAANVGLNITSLEGRCSLCGVLGKDHFGRSLYQLIKKGNINPSLIIKDNLRPTTLKSRIVAGHQQVVRVDWESTQEISLSFNKKITSSLVKNIDNFHSVIIEDYGKGLITPFLLKEIVEICRKKKKMVIVDPKEEHFDYYYNTTALTPNLREAETAAGMKIKSKKDLSLAGEIIMDKLHLNCLLITLGEEGMELFTKEKQFHIPTFAHEVFDVTGAGDTVVAVFTLSLASGASFLEAAYLANYAAGIVVGKLGTATVTRKELLGRI